MFFSGYASAHSWTPTYPKFLPSYMDKVVETEMTLFNKRPDVEYYRISVLDKNMEPVIFASINKVYKVNYLEKKKIMIFLREESLVDALYICSRSMFVKTYTSTNRVSTRICSKIR